MELTTTINSSFSRTRGNELNKGYYPTFSYDVQTVLRILEPSFGWKSRRYNPQKIISILDPCAGEGDFLATVTKWLKRCNAAANGAPHEILSYAVEMDASSFARIHGATQKLNSSKGGRLPGSGPNPHTEGSDRRLSMTTATNSWHCFQG